MTTDVLKKKLNEMTEFLGITLTEQQYRAALDKLSGGINAGSGATHVRKIEAAMGGPPHIRGAMQYAIAEARRFNLKLDETLATDIDGLNIALSDKKVPTDARFRIKSALAACGCID